MWSSFADTLPFYGLAALGLAPSAAADYYVDNANDTIAYSASGTAWQTFSFATQNLTLDLSNGNVTVDSSKCYDQNYALAGCTVDNKCQITFPFTGSGISVYVVHAGFQGTSATLTVDGTRSVTTTLPPPAPPSYQTPNVSLFSLQSLPSADHTATINLLNWNNGPTSLYFDCALINESYVELPVSSSTSSDAYTTTTAIHRPLTAQLANASSTLPAPIFISVGSTHTPGATFLVSNADSSVSLSVVVGSVCGGLAGLIAVVAAVIFLKKRKSRYAALEESRKPDPFLATPAPARVQIALFPVQFQTDQKRRMRLAAADTTLHRSSGQSDGASTRIPEVEAGPSTPDHASRDDPVTDQRHEDRLSSDFRGSVVRNTPRPTVAVDSTPPDTGIQTLKYL